MLRTYVCNIVIVLSVRAEFFVVCNFHRFCGKHINCENKICETNNNSGGSKGAHASLTKKKIAKDQDTLIEQSVKYSNRAVGQIL